MGMDNITGKTISGKAYLRQRIVNALTTPKSSTVMLRARGFDYKSITDEPMDGGFAVNVYQAVASALNSPLAGLPDFRLTRVRLTSVEDSGAGTNFFTIEGKWLPFGEIVAFEGLAV